MEVIRKILKNKAMIFTLLLLVFCYFLGTRIAIYTNAKVVAKENWGLGFHTEGKQPTANVTADELKQYDAYYIGDADDKVIYLTFDAGYENGYTDKILDALKKHEVPATFFLVGHYIESSPDLVKRMVEEGHQVANHTYSHPNMSSLSSMEAS